MTLPAPSLSAQRGEACHEYPSPSRVLQAPDLYCQVLHRWLPGGLWFALVLMCSPAQAIYKCHAQGAVTYSDRPCAGQATDLHSETAAPASQRQEEDALRREKAEVARLQRIREQRERQDQQIRDLSARGAAARDRKCKSLALQLRWRQEDLRDASLQEEKKARVRARRAAEKFGMECQ